MYLRVYPSQGSVVLSCPWHISDSRIEIFIKGRIPWIKKHLSEKSHHVRKKEMLYVTGEQIQLWGKKRKLAVYETSKPQQIFSGSDDKVIMLVKGNSTPEKRKMLLDDWFRNQLKNSISVYIRKWEPVMNVKVRDFGVRKMKTRWGSCNIRDKRIWLNLELVKLDINCLEGVIVHEMVHLLERHHSKRFYHLMDKFLPDWKVREHSLRFTECNSY